MQPSNGRRATIADIARKVGVSPSTVSIVARGEDKKRHISVATTQRVRDVMAEMNYVHNSTARNFRLQRSGMIGVLLANLRMDWAEAVLGGMLEVFQPNGYAPFIGIHGFETQLARRELLSCAQRRDEGVICQPVPGENENYDRIRQSATPLVFLGDHPPDLPDVSFVAWDSAAAARTAVRHLIETGRRRIAFLGCDYPMIMSRARHEAYESVLRAAGLCPKPHWVAVAPLEWSLDRIVNWATDRLFPSNREHPDAVFALNDGLALPLLEVLTGRGIRVPEDVAIIGMGDLSMTGHQGISLSTVGEPCVELGKQAAEVMLELISNPGKAPIHRLIPGENLKVRRTTGRPTGVPGNNQ